MFPPSLFILAMRSYNLMYRSHTKDDKPSCHSPGGEQVRSFESFCQGMKVPLFSFNYILFSFTCCGTGWITHHTHHWITSLTWGQGAIATRPHLLLNKRQGQSSMSHGGVKIKVQLAQRTENLAKQAAAEDESHPPSQGHRHMRPCSDLLFCSAITQLNYTSLLSCSHDDLDLGTNRDNLLDFCCFGSWTKPRTTAKPEFNDPPRPIGDVHTQMFLDGRKSHVKISAMWRFRGHH